MNLRASTAAFARDLDKVQQLSFDSAKAIERSWNIIGTAMGAAMTAAVGAMVAGIEKTVEWEVHMGHLAQSAGTTVETMSGLSYVAKQMGVDIDSVASALERFDKQMVSAQLGNKNAGRNMSLLGIDPAQIKTSDDALMKLADHFALMPNGALKSAEAVQAFGKSGAAMIPILNLGSKGIQDFIDEAGRMGIVITTDQAKQAEDFEKNITRMKESLHGLWVEITNATIPALNKMDAHWADTAKAYGSLAAIAEFYKASLTPSGMDKYLFYGQELIDQQDKIRAAVTTSTLAVDEHQKAIDALHKSVEALVEKEDIARVTVGMSAAGVELYTLGVKAAQIGDTAWSASKIALIGWLERETLALKQIHDFDLQEGQRKIDLADKLRLLQLETTEMAKQLDITQMQFDRTSPVGQQSQAFTDSIKSQTAALEHQIATFGMSAEAIARYDLAQLSVAASGSKDIAVFAGVQAQLAGMNAQQKLVTDATKQSAEAWKMFGDAADRSLNDMIFSGKSFTQVLSDITKQIGEMFLKWSLFGFGQSSFKSGSGLGLFGALQGLLGLASGGPVSAGSPYLVGESGPELFVPAMAGRIIPNGAVGGGGATVVYNIDARGSSITEEQFVRSLAVTESRAVQRALNMTREISLRTA